MDFESLLDKVANLPLFESSLLFAGDVDKCQIRVQLSRWVAAGKIIQLRRGLYTLAPRYRKVDLHPFVAAAYLNRSSYISLQTALAYYDLIPENLSAVVCITVGRPEQIHNAVGDFEYRHLSNQYFWGYRPLAIGEEVVFMAQPEKALLDLVYLTPGADDPLYINEMRLQNTERYDIACLCVYADRFRMPKMTRAANILTRLFENEREEYEDL